MVILPPHILKIVWLSCLAALFTVPAGSSDALAWDVRLSANPHGPSLFLAIDKSEQTLMVMEQQSPLSVAREYVCSTGEMDGDKELEGDLRTPEGVYFIERRLEGGLDWDLYGDLAHTLNYPNPVDRLRGKTGFGIWIHGRGHDITPQETKGCVAMNNPDIHDLDPLLASGIPVIIADNVEWTDTMEDPEIPQQLEQAVRDWAMAWSERSETFFSFYDEDKFSITEGSPFSLFRSHKENLFANLAWIQVLVYDLQILPGPDYWVTSFAQYYRSSGLISQGIKRLYWQMDDGGVLRIVGKEWIGASDLGLEERYLAGLDDSILATVEAWREAWEQADLDAYIAFYLPKARQDHRFGVESIREHKEDLWSTARPRTVDLDSMDIRSSGQGVEIRFTQRYIASNGYEDVGLKTLVLVPQGDNWLISGEYWRAL